MMFRLMSPQPPYVFEPTLAIAAITVFRLPLSTPCSWNACRVVARVAFALAPSAEQRFEVEAGHEQHFRPTHVAV